MQHADYNDAFIDRREVQAVGKTRDQGASFRGINGRKAERAGTHIRNRLIDRRAEPLAKARAAILVPLLGIKQFSHRLWSEDDRYAHRSE
jgi:hypothetical protein